MTPPPNPAAAAEPDSASAAPDRRGPAVADLIGGVAFGLLGLFAIAGALQLPADDARGPGRYLVSTAALPLLAGAGLALGGLAVAWQAGRRLRRISAAAETVTGKRVRLADARRPLLVLGGIVAYAGVLIGGLLPFWAATYFFLGFAMVWLRAAKVGAVIAISLGTSLGLHFLFGTLMRLPLP